MLALAQYNYIYYTSGRFSRYCSLNRQDRQTDRQTDRHTQAGRQTDRQKTDRQIHRQAGWQTENRQSDRQTDRQTDRQRLKLPVVMDELHIVLEEKADHHTDALDEVEGGTTNGWPG